MTQRTLLIGLVCNLLFFAPAFAQDTIGWRTDGTGRHCETRGRWEKTEASLDRSRGVVRFGPR